MDGISQLVKYRSLAYWYCVVHVLFCAWHQYFFAPSIETLVCSLFRAQGPDFREMSYCDNTIIQEHTIMTIHTVSSAHVRERTNKYEIGEN